MKLVPIVGAAFLLVGCAGQKTMYEWGSYQPALVNYAKNADKTAFEKELRETIAKAEKKDRVPPGVYADLGYLLMEQGKGAEAATYFVKERERFPESGVFMTKLIAGAESQSEETAQ
ncbi:MULTISPECIES: DUF4810 domain-containing protein [Novosphingobium]|uniref:DUF4810 domain-containing protein n=1 Tax=Novosphingobium decolorationis TaxID=2698673 RepID=A0ABX8E5M2_9SPHN|nr:MULTISPECIES: DUF4810 domain-containing protein [Novosphingobium]QVM84148.1 DUF4810 domain-containing protein [Novosphingobium decolorationis]